MFLKCLDKLARKKTRYGTYINLVTRRLTASINRLKSFLQEVFHPISVTCPNSYFQQTSVVEGINPVLSGMAFSHWASVFLVGFSVLVFQTDSQGELLCKTKNIVFI